MLSVLLLVLATVSVIFAQSEPVALTEFKGELKDFLGEVNSALPDSAVVGGTWSDAYIGQILGIPPHFGVGVAGGISRFPVSALKNAIALSGSDLPVDTLVLPNFAIEARAGGFLLPFDVGVRLGVLPSSVLESLGVKDISIQYIDFGADIRYALLKDGLLPGISLGIGYYHTSGKIDYLFDAQQLSTVQFPAGYDSTENLGITFSTNVIEAKAQISKNLLIATPYAGVAAYTSISESSYELASVKDTLTTKDEPVYGARIYGGTSFNLLIIKTDISLMYNVLTENWGGNLGIRVQL
jgi:hypothetical protein